MNPIMCLVSIESWLKKIANGWVWGREENKNSSSGSQFLTHKIVNSPLQSLNSLRTWGSKYMKCHKLVLIGKTSQSNMKDILCPSPRPLILISGPVIWNINHNIPIKYFPPLELDYLSSCKCWILHHAAGCCCHSSLSLKINTLGRLSNVRYDGM